MPSKIDETREPEVVRAFARQLYEAYTANSDNLNFQGNQCPAWDELPTAIRSHWCAVAHKVKDLLRAEVGLG